MKKRDLLKLEVQRNFESSVRHVEIVESEVEEGRGPEGDDQLDQNEKNSFHERFCAFPVRMDSR